METPMANNPNVRKNLRKSGKKGNKGGGRKPDEFRQWASKLVKSKKVRKFVSDLISGEAIEEKICDDPVTGDSQIQLVSAPAKVRVDMIRYLMDQSHGKAMQPTEISGKNETPLTVKVINYGD